MDIEKGGIEVIDAFAKGNMKIFKSVILTDIYIYISHLQMQGKIWGRPICDQ